MFRGRVRRLQEEILRLKERENAFILAHNYQVPEIQEVADAVGDSLELARIAQKKRGPDVIVFSAVDFMAETAAILNPDREVYVPDPTARCPMALMCPREVVSEAKRVHNGVPVVLYINTLAEAKAEADVVCTSANAPTIVEKVGAERVLFGPDKNLGLYVEKITGVRVIPVPEDGYCYVHTMFEPRHIARLRRRHPDAVVMVHPECTLEVQRGADFVGSTSQMYRYAKDSKHEKFIVGTEVGLVDRMRREIEGKTFIPALSRAVCKNMKKNTLEKIRRVLLEKPPENLVMVPEDVANKAKRSIERMLELSEKGK
ncbi:MAG: quinolinate synthase NadA [Candidatus Freyarchaeota archaeon]|nr:quinolinate synthase NadA [Candidatus Jordarchaeia archaeon]